MFKLAARLAAAAVVANLVAVPLTLQPGWLLFEVGGCLVLAALLTLTDRWERRPRNDIAVVALTLAVVCLYVPVVTTQLVYTAAVVKSGSLTRALADAREIASYWTFREQSSYVPAPYFLAVVLAWGSAYVPFVFAHRRGLGRMDSFLLGTSAVLLAAPVALLLRAPSFAFHALALAFFLSLFGGTRRTPRASGRTPRRSPTGARSVTLGSGDTSM